MNFIWETVAILLIGFCLIRIAGKKTVGEMSGLEIITLLSIASVIAHAVSEEGFWKTTVTLFLFVILLVTVQYMAIKFNFVEKIFVGKSTLVIQEGKIIIENLNKLRLSVDQLEGKLKEKGISSASDVKIATIEFTGHLGYELMRHAKPVTIGELEKLITQLSLEKELPKN